MPKLIGIAFPKPYTLWLQYDDQTTGTVDCTPRNPQSVFQRFADREFFQQATIDRKHNTIVRDENLDMDALGCYCEISGKDFYSLDHK